LRMLHFREQTSAFPEPAAQRHSRTYPHSTYPHSTYPQQRRIPNSVVPTQFRTHTVRPTGGKGRDLRPRPPSKARALYVVPFVVRVHAGGCVHPHGPMTDVPRRIRASGPCRSLTLQVSSSSVPSEATCTGSDVISFGGDLDSRRVFGYKSQSAIPRQKQTVTPSEDARRRRAGGSGT
jgi:hypothetical protein